MSILIYCNDVDFTSSVKNRIAVEFWLELFENYFRET